MKEPFLLQHFLKVSAEHFPDKTALKIGPETLTFAKWEEQSNQLAHYLNRLGVKRGDRVAIFLDNSLASALAIFAVLKAGGVFIIVNPTIKAHKLNYILNDAGVRVLITQDNKNEIVRMAIPSDKSGEKLVILGIGEGMPGEVSPWSNLYNFPPTSPKEMTIDLDLAALIYTSGTTGEPKGVMLSHRNMLTAARSIISYLENTSEDCILNCLPFSFDYGLYQLLMSAAFGGRLVIERSFLYPYAIIETLKKEAVTGLPFVPTVARMLLHFKDFSAEHIPSLRYFTNTAQTLPEITVQEIRQRFPESRLYLMYGLTECKRVSYLPPEEVDRHPQSVGIPIPNTEVLIVNDEGKEVPPGTVGELVVRGSNVMYGYWNKPQENAAVLHPGRFPGEQLLYSGDLFYRDEEGFLYFVSRKDEIIKTRGEKVSPKEIEEEIYRMEAVAEVKVTGVSDELLGEAIKAYIVTKPGREISAREVIAHCQRQLESFMVPKYVEFVPELPKTESGKIKSVK